MKYISTIYKTIRETVTVEAPDPRAAITQIRQSHRDFTCDDVSELIEVDGEQEEGKNFEVVAECENCDLLIFDGELYVPLEDCTLCPKCHQACMEQATEKGGL